MISKYKVFDHVMVDGEDGLFEVTLVDTSSFSQPSYALRPDNGGLQDIIHRLEEKVSLPLKEGDQVRLKITAQEEVLQKHRLGVCGNTKVGDEGTIIELDDRDLRSEALALVKFSYGQVYWYRKDLELLKDRDLR